MVNQKKFEDYEPKPPVEIKPIEPVVELEDDCRHRNENNCIKHNKKIAIDARQPQHNCWERRMGCEDFEKKVKA